MAAVIDMGEVDEIHSKEEAIKDGIVLNGDTSSVKSNDEENETVPNEEVMEVEENQESDENDVEASSINNDVEAPSIENDGDANSIENDVEATSIDNDVEATSVDNDVEGASTENDVEATSIEIDDDSNHSSVAIGKSNAVVNNRYEIDDDDEVEIHSIDNSDDEVNEIIDDEIEDEEKDDQDDVHFISEENDMHDKDDQDDVHFISEDNEMQEKDEYDEVHIISEENEIQEKEQDEIHIIPEENDIQEKEHDDVHIISEENDKQEKDEQDDIHIISEEPEVVEKDEPEKVHIASSRGGEVVESDDKKNSKDSMAWDTSKKEKENELVLNDSGDGDVEIIEDLPKQNGKSFSPDSNDEPHKIDDDDDDVITLDTPTKKPKKQNTVETPRRSARNLNKRSRRSYVEKEKDESTTDEESDIEEILPEDPLAVADPLAMQEKVIYTKKKLPKAPPTSTIVVKDTKRLVEIASKSTPPTMGKKEPTLVIIDASSVLSGRGPIPINPKPAITQPYPVLPMALPAQGVYPPNMRATITPIPMHSTTQSHTIQSKIQLPAIQLSQVQTTSTITQHIPQKPPPQQQPPQHQPPPPPQPPILPSLTDDMFVVEAPSFIVPYVYEKPPVKDLKEFVDDFAKRLRALIAAEEKERLLAEQKEIERELNEKKEKEKELKEKKEKEQQDDEKNSENMEAKSNDEKKSSEKKEEDETTDEKVEKMEVDEDKNETENKCEEKSKPEEVPVENKEEPKVSPKKDNFKLDSGQSSSRSKPYSYFESPLGKFFVDIGHSLVQEYVQTDLLKQQKRKREREGGKNPETNKTISSLIKNLEYTKENNEPFHMPIKKCEFCSFKTESALAMSFHLETPHMKNFVYRCNFCPYEIRSPHDILFHMEAEHMIRGRLERAPAFHQCPNCPFEDNQKGKLSRHMVACTRKFKPDRNLEPPMEWEPPAKIPRVPRMKQSTLTNTAAMYQAMTKSTQYQLMQKMQNAQSALNRGRGRPSLGTIKQPAIMRTPTSMIYKTSMSGGSVLLPTNYQLSGNQLYQQQTTPNKTKPLHQPSISITPLPRTTSTPQTPASKPGDSNSKNSFVICEICDGYIKDLEQLRNHMQWIHKVKIHPKMIYNRPPLNCQKCQFRFFTDQGLERHLLGSHGLVTSSMQEAANKSKDSGRCPVCGRVYQWKLLNHVARDHNMTLKPAHLSYKCTVCTATFGMYKQFENHVYSAHSVVAKRVMDKKSASPQASSNNSSTAKNSNDSLLKPLKINDEITIIPQLPKSSSAPSTSREESSITTSAKNSISVTTTPSTSRNEQLSRAERLARRKTSSGVDN